MTIWKDFIPGYQVSNLGLIKKLKLKAKRLEQIKPGTKRTYQARYLSLMIKSRWYYVHKIVAQAFVHNPNPLVFTEVLHINGDTTDNRAENLKWVHISEIPKLRAYEGQPLKPNNKYRIKYHYEIILSGTGESLGLYSSMDHAKDVMNRLENQAKS